MKHSLVRTKYRLGPPLHALTKKFGRFLVCLFAQNNYSSFPLRQRPTKKGRQVANQKPSYHTVRSTIIRYNNCVDEEKA